MNFIQKLLGIQEKKPTEFPYHYLQIVFTENGLHRGTLDDYSKEIQRIKGGRIIERIQYTEEEVIALTKSFNIPLVDRTKIKSEEFQFEDVNALTGQFTEIR
jgi:hypothetical protein